MNFSQLSIESVAVELPTQVVSSATLEDRLGPAIRRLKLPARPISLLTGIEVMQLAGLNEGPAIGAALEEVEEARADGLIRTHAEAVEWLRERYARR